MMQPGECGLSALVLLVVPGIEVLVAKQTRFLKCVSKQDAMTVRKKLQG